MAIEDQNVNKNVVDDKFTEPLLRGDQSLVDENGGSTEDTRGKDSLWMVYLSTFVAVCGSLSFGTGIGYSSPTQNAIREDLSLSLAEAKIGKHKEFETALQKLRGKNADISHEAAEIQEYIETLEQLPKASLLDLFQKRYLRAVIIGVGLMVIQQFGGINAISFYAANIFQTAGFSPSAGTTSYALLQVVVTGFNIVMIDRAGRKPLLLFAGTGLLFGCLLLAAAFFLKAHELALESVPALTLTGVLVFIGAFSSGMGATPWVLMSEIFPINIKGAGGSLTTLVNWFGAWAVSYTFNFLNTWSSYGTFLLYAVVNVLGIVFIAIVVPETKGRTLEEIQAAMDA